MGKSLDALSLNAPAAPPAVQDQPHLRDKSWFYGAITRAECDNLLNQYGQDGDFLVRSSETNVRVFFLNSVNFNDILYTTRWEITQFH